METAPTNGREQPGAPEASSAGAQTKQQTENAGAGPEPASQARRSQPRAPVRHDYGRIASLWQISREMDRLADLFFRKGAEEWWAPQIEVKEQGDQLLVHADLPGIKPDDVRVEISSEGLVISGERNEHRSDPGEQDGYRRTERRYGSFYRSIPLPEGARTDEAKANLEHGVLEIAIPLESGGSRRRIQINGR